MIKELEALECLEALEKDIKDRIILAENRQLKLCAVIQQAILELQSIKEAEPSEALKCLEHIKKDDFNMLITTYPPQPAYNGITKGEMFDKIEQALLKARKEHKALEIIKEKGCDISWLKYCIKENLIVEAYNSGYHEYDKKLTEEQFNLLKEVLK